MSKVADRLGIEEDHRARSPTRVYIRHKHYKDGRGYLVEVTETRKTRFLRRCEHNTTVPQSADVEEKRSKAWA